MIIKRKEKIRTLSIIVSLLMLLSVISFPAVKAKASGTVDDFVERCYTVTLGRGSDPDGFAAWKNRLLNSECVGMYIAHGFLFADEYVDKKKSDEDYVTDLYHLFMGREPDSDGFNIWVNLLKSGSSREDVFKGFSNSPEFFDICAEYGITAGYYTPAFGLEQVNNVNLFVERLYQTTLGRRCDIYGQENWVTALLNGEITGMECASLFVQSSEFVDKNLSDSEYVESLYQAMMGRPSDPDGKSGWLRMLSKGMTRDEVFEGFANSPEFIGICNSYGITPGTYTAKDKGSYDPDKKSEIKAGDIILLGKYEQDGIASNGKEDIEWQVLSVEGNKAFVVSKYGLDNPRYNNTETSITWETCSLRKWLNNDFYSKAFSENEKQRIPKTTVTTGDNAITGTPGGNNTNDYLFCLSLDEVQTYFGSYNWYREDYHYGANQNLMCLPTQYAINNGAFSYLFTENDYIYAEDPNYGYWTFNYTRDIIGKRTGTWWLRSPGSDSKSVNYVDHVGFAGDTYDSRPDNTHLMVRPAMYVYID